MNNLINREALKTIESIQSADFNSIETIREWIDDAPTVPTIPISVIEQIKAEIKESSHGKWYVGRADGKTEEVLLFDEVMEIINEHIKEYTK